jgi:polyhydroxyalkanoate synthase
MANENGAPADLWDLFDKYAEGVKTIVEGAQADTGQTPKEVIWTKNKAKLYHYQTHLTQKPRRQQAHPRQWSKLRAL